MLKAHLPTELIYLLAVDISSACGSDAHREPDASLQVDAARADAAPTIDCSTMSKSVFLDSPEASVRIVSQNALMVGNATARLGVFGVSEAGDTFFLRRDGDYSDGSLDPGSYDAGWYPYHMRLDVWPEASGNGCEFNPQCRSYFGLSGRWTIAAGTTFQGTLQIGTITQQEDCWKEGPPPDVSHCVVLPGSFTGCFNVELVSSLRPARR